ncbi:unnamed protein product, partial [Phaeothamnion confervicola]
SVGRRRRLPAAALPCRRLWRFLVAGLLWADVHVCGLLTVLLPSRLTVRRSKYRLKTGPPPADFRRVTLSRRLINRHLDMHSSRRHRTCCGRPASTTVVPAIASLTAAATTIVAAVACCR